MSKREEKELQEAIGNRIKEIRVEKHISQAKLAKLTHIENTTISAYENHKKNIGLANLAKIANGLDVSIETLYYGSEEESPITRAGMNVGRKIVNCIFELYKENVIKSISKDQMDGSINWNVGQFERPLNKLIITLNSMGGDYDSTLEQAAYVENVKNTTAYEINLEKKQLENRRRMICLDKEI